MIPAANPCWLCKPEIVMQPFTTSIAEAAHALSLGRTKIYELIDAGRLETIKIGRRRLIKVDSIRRLLADRT